MEYAEPVQTDQDKQRQHFERQPKHRQVGRVKGGDDGHGTEIIDDGERRQEHFQRHRHARSQQRQHAERKGNVGGCGNRPAAQVFRLSEVDGYENQRRHDHAAYCGEAGKSPARPGRELAFDELALDLKPDEQKEHGHQAVVNPVQYTEPTQVEAERRDVASRQR
jgi:hypothetical protein